MKVIYPIRINTLVADEEAAGFEVENLLDDSPKNLWKGTSQDAKLTFTMYGGASAVGIANTNAQAIDFTLKDALGATIESASYDMTGISNLLEFITNLGYYSFTSLIIPYTYQAGVHTIDLDLDTESAGTDIHAGIARAGFTYGFKNPHSGVKHGLKDFSVKDKYNNGARYYELGDIVNVFEASATLARDASFFLFMRNLALQFGETPQLWQISDLENHFWTVFAALEGLPSGTHGYPDHSILDVKWEEVV